MTQPAPPAKKGLPALAWVGIGCGGLLLLTIIAVTIISIVFFRWMGTFMADDPMQFEEVTASQEEVQTLLDRFDGFKTALEGNQDAEPLRLTGRDLNLLVAHHPDWLPFQDIVFFEISDGQLGGMLSLPLGEFIPNLQGKYLNGSGQFKIGLHQGDLDIFLQELEVNGQSLPEEFMRDLRREDFYDANSTDPEVDRLIQQLDTIEVEGNEIIITPLPADQRP